MAIASAFAVSAQEPGTPASGVAATTPAKMLSCEKGSGYPGKEIFRVREGWLNLMGTVKTDGSVTDVRVISAFGRGEFEAAAMKWVQSCRFTPAMAGGKPVETKDIVIPFQFRLADLDPGADRAIVARLREVSKLVDAGHMDEAWAALDVIEAQTTRLYEMAHIMLRRAAILAHRGDGDLALGYLRQLRFVQDSLTPSELASVDRLKLELEIATGRLAEAEETFKSIKNLGRRDLDKELVRKLDDLRQQAASLPEVAINGGIPRNCPDYICGNEPFWSYAPSRRTVSLANIEGRLDLVEGRCAGKRFSAPAQAGVTWTFPKSWTNCTVRVTGEPGARFTLIDLTVQPPAQ